jgi:hypothetical protein
MNVTGALQQAAFAEELVKDSYAYLAESAKKRGITSQKFSKVVRHLSFEHNIFEEMQLFSKINTSASGVISFEEWSDAVLNRIDVRLPKYAQKLQLMYLEAHPSCHDTHHAAVGEQKTSIKHAEALKNQKEEHDLAIAAAENEAKENRDRAASAHAKAAAAQDSHLSEQEKMMAELAALKAELAAMKTGGGAAAGGAKSKRDSEVIIKRATQRATKLRLTLSSQILEEGDDEDMRETLSEMEDVLVEMPDFDLSLMNARTRDDSTMSTVSVANSEVEMLNFSSPVETLELSDPARTWTGTVARVDGQKQAFGAGEFEFKDGRTYKGYAKDNKMHGEGTLVWSDTGSMYKGQFADGLPHGSGRYDGNQYITDEEAAEAEGTKQKVAEVSKTGGGEGGGVATVAAPSAGMYPGVAMVLGFTSGEAGDGEGKEEGKEVEKEEEREEAKVVNGKKVKTLFHYDGQWKDGVYHGDGELVIATDGQVKKDIYVGEFKAGERHGEGHYYYANSDEYHGEFKRGKCHGHGTFVEAGGMSVFIGEYSGSLRKGHGLCFSKMPPPPLLDEEVDYTLESSLWPAQQPLAAKVGEQVEGWDGDVWQVYDGTYAKSNRHGQGALSIMLDPQGALEELRKNLPRTGHGGTEARVGIENADPDEDVEGEEENARRRALLSKFVIGPNLYNGEWKDDLPSGQGLRHFFCRRAVSAADGGAGAVLQQLVLIGTYYGQFALGQIEGAGECWYKNMKKRYTRHIIPDRLTQLAALEDNDDLKIDTESGGSVVSKWGYFERILNGKDPHGKLHGAQGEEDFQSGDGWLLYRGSFKAGKRHGKGKLLWERCDPLVINDDDEDEDDMVDEERPSDVSFALQQRTWMAATAYLECLRSVVELAKKPELMSNVSLTASASSFDRLMLDDDEEEMEWRHEGPAVVLYDGEWEHDQRHGTGKGTLVCTDWVPAKKPESLAMLDVASGEVIQDQQKAPLDAIVEDVANAFIAAGRREPPPRGTTYGCANCFVLVEGDYNGAFVRGAAEGYVAYNMSAPAAAPPHRSYEKLRSTSRPPAMTGAWLVQQLYQPQQPPTHPPIFLPIHQPTTNPPTTTTTTTNHPPISSPSNW